jgi:hypothetical protein
MTSLALCCTPRIAHQNKNLNAHAGEENSSQKKAPVKGLFHEQSVSDAGSVRTDKNGNLIKLEEELQ